MPAAPFLREPRRIFHQAVRQEERQHADRQIDEEDPVPVVVVGDPAAERGADGGRHHDGHAVHREGHAAFFRRKRIGQDGLFGRLQTSAAGALQDAGDDEHRQAGRDAAQKRART